ncbi:MAG: hypothetical protein KAS39_09055, partial [Actinomycetia bacterium]|nr:hypothetical protein [Actinomycetes bacterium]
LTEPVRILSIGVGLGQEPYSIAMLLEDNKDLYGEMKFTIDGVDIVSRNLVFAEVGIYDQQLLRFFTRYEELHFQDYYKKYFTEVKKDEKLYRINENIRDRVTFKKLNIAEDDIDKEYDIIFFRNVMIYFHEDKKAAIIAKLFRKMKVGSYLFLGHGEFPLGVRDKFETIFYNNSVIYKKMKE